MTPHKSINVNNIQISSGEVWNVVLGTCDCYLRSTGPCKLQTVGGAATLCSCSRLCLSTFDNFSVISGNLRQNITRYFRRNFAQHASSATSNLAKYLKLKGTCNFWYFCLICLEMEAKKDISAPWVRRRWFLVLMRSTCVNGQISNLPINKYNSSDC